MTIQTPSKEGAKGIDEVKIHTTFDKITEGFKQYQVHSIELWISGLLETDTITRQVVNAEGEEEMKVVIMTNLKEDRKEKVKSLRGPFQTIYSARYTSKLLAY